MVFSSYCSDSSCQFIGVYRYSIDCSCYFIDFAGYFIMFIVMGLICIAISLIFIAVSLIYLAISLICIARSFFLLQSHFFLDFVSPPKTYRLLFKPLSFFSLFGRSGSEWSLLGFERLSFFSHLVNFCCRFNDFVAISLTCIAIFTDFYCCFIEHYCYSIDFYCYFINVYC